MDAFYASIEQRDRPELAGRPVIVGGLGRRGVVSTASYEARVFGVHSAMPMAEARRRCPHAAFLPPRMEAYVAVSQQVAEVMAGLTDLVEPLSLDEAFLDVTASQRLFGDGAAIATRLRAEVARRTRLTVSVGVASCKYVAKVASDLCKPDGLLVVPPGGEAAFLAPLPVARLWGAGRVTAARLEQAGFRTIGDVAAADPGRLVALLGDAAGHHLHELARGLDERPVAPPGPPLSIGRETTFEHDLHDADAARAVLLALAGDVGRRLREHGLLAGTVRLKLRFPPFETHTRQRALPAPTDDDRALFGVAATLLDEAAGERPLRLLGVAATDLQPAGAPRQGELFPPPADRGSGVDAALDAVRRRFGPGAARRAGADPRHED